MKNKPEWPDDTFENIMKGKGYSEVKWEDLAPQVQYVIKAEKASGAS